jgi:rSAM/selenodomain-associated transferase 1
MSLRVATSPDAVLVVFARAPVPGRVKTRLVPLLGKEGAARLHRQLLGKTLATAVKSGLDVTLCCTPSTQQFKATRKIQLQSQGRGDLGERLYRACARALRSHKHVIVIGSDCPVLKVADLRAALRALRGGADAVLSPAEDGGYALIGLGRVRRSLFAGVDWGTNRVLGQTRARLARLGWRWRELRTLWDVDRPEDVARLSQIAPDLFMRSKTRSAIRR